LRKEESGHPRRHHATEARECHAGFEHEHRGDETFSLALEGLTTRGVFEAYLEAVFAPTLSPGQVVTDNLSLLTKALG
jgi:hypothetical protein